MTSRKEKLHISKTKANVILQFRCLHVQKNWPWKEKFDKFLNMLSEFGLTNKWIADFIGLLNTFDDVKASSLSHMDQLKMEHFYSAYVIWIIGIVCGLFAFIARN